MITSCIGLAKANAQDIMRQLKFSVVTYIRGFASFDESTTSTTGASSNVYVKVHLDKTFDATDAMRILKAKKVLVPL